MRKTLTLKARNGTLKVTIDFIGNELVPDEVRHTLNTLTEKVQVEMAKAPYMSEYTHNVKVKP